MSLRFFFVWMTSFLMVSVAQASRPATYDMTCEEAADLVAARGRVVMTYRYDEKSGPLYQMFYSTAVMCERDLGYQAWVKTKDSPSCFVGYACRSTDSATP